MNSKTPPKSTNKRMDRRHFLATAALGASATVGLACRNSDTAAPTTPKPAKPTNDTTQVATPPALGPQAQPLLKHAGMALGGGRGKDKTTGEAIYWLAIVDIEKGRKVARIPTHFFPHGLAIHPNKPNIVVAFQKHGAGSCEIDLATQRVTRRIETIQGQQFYGHGAYSRDGRSFYCTETAVDRGYRGLLMVRDSATLKTLGEMPTGGKEPHDCMLINKGRTLVVTNGGGHVDNGGEGSVTYVDVATQAVQHRLLFTDPSINAGHLWLTSKGDLAVVSAPRSGLDLKDPKIHGALSFFSPGKDKKLRTITDPIIGSMRAETLSVAIHEPSMVVGATNPEGNLLTFWDFASGKLLKSYRNLKGPRGIALTLDGKHFVVTHGDTAELATFDVRTLNLVPSRKVDWSWITGSHVTAHHWT